MKDSTKLWIIAIVVVIIIILLSLNGCKPNEPEDFPEENPEPTLYPTEENIYFTGWYWVANNSLINVTRCGNLSSLRFMPNISHYNITLKNLTQVNVTPVNHSLYFACDYNITNIAGRTINVTFNVNATKDRYNLTLSGANVTTIFADTTRRVFKYYLSNGSNVLVNLTMTYKNVTNNTGTYHFYINFSGV